MITVLRKQFKGSIKYILWIIMGAFIIGMMPLLFRNQNQSYGIWALRVNGQEVGYRDFMQEVEKQRQRIIAFRSQYGEYADWLLATMGANNPKKNAYDALVRQELINQFADSLGIYLSPEYVMQKLSDRDFVSRELAHILPPQLFDEQTGELDERVFGQYLRHIGLSAEVFERMLERELSDRLAMDIISSGFYVPQFDVKQRFMSENAKKSFTILTLNKDAYLKKEEKKQISVDQLKAFYDEQNARAKRYWVDEKRSGSMWVFDPKSYGISISDDEAQRYYEQNKVKLYVDKAATVQVRRILFKVSDEAMRAKIQVKAARTKDDIMENPSRFAQVAKERSEDAETAKDGGLMKPFSRGEHEHVFERAAFTLTEDGAISDVIETKDGIELLQRVNKQAQTYKSFDSVKNEIKQELATKQFSSQFSKDLKRVIQEDSVNQNDFALKAFIKEHGGKAQPIKEQNLDDSSLAQHLFKTPLNEVAFYVDGQEGVALRVTGIKERYLPTLESIEKTVKDDFIDHKASLELGEQAQKAKAALEAESITEVQKAYPGEVMHTGLIARDDEKSLESLTKKGINTDKMLQLEKNGSVLVDVAGDKAYIVRLDEISYPTEQDFEAQGAEMMAKVEEDRMRQYLDGFVASLHRNATIETNESVITLQDV